mmetsp:Transcript_32085/g.52027  ORF Transcript_32085/g.52027 Transcript_32085/m.52027 type:complete len:93 (+) Transcript_32085:50-328(+)
MASVQRKTPDALAHGVAVASVVIAESPLVALVWGDVDGSARPITSLRLKHGKQFDRSLAVHDVLVRQRGRTGGGRETNPQVFSFRVDLGGSE